MQLRLRQLHAFGVDRQAEVGVAVSPGGYEDHAGRQGGRNPGELRGYDQNRAFGKNCFAGSDDSGRGTSSSSSSAGSSSSTGGGSSSSTGGGSAVGQASR